MNQKNLRTIFYGDDTWLKLFPPESFVRYEGTSSFYVSDYTEVDNNVTRNVLLELKHPGSWDVMILHYLGLDHIGHMENSFSPLIQIKLEEMDSIMELIHKGLIENKINSGEDFILVVTGDHGMRDMGGHGGSTKPETLVPFLTLGMNCKLDKNREMKTSDTKHLETQKRISLNDKVNKMNIEHENTASQVDVTPTLAVLLGLPIPSCNTGKLIPKLLQNLTLSELLYAYYYNTKQISDSYFNSTDQIINANQIFSHHYSLLQNTFPSEDQVVSTISHYSELLTSISANIIRSSTHVDTYMVFIALVISVLGTLITIIEPNITFCKLSVFCLTCLTMLVNTFFNSSIIFNIFISYLLSIQVETVYQTIQINIKTFRTKKQTLDSNKGKQSSTNCPNIEFKGINDVDLENNSSIEENPFSTQMKLLVFLTGMTILCCLSTSYIENEHNVWMYVLNTFLFYILLNTKHKSKQSAILAMLILHRLLRSINVKWLDEEADVSCTLSYWFQLNNPMYLTVFSSLSLISVYLVCLIIEHNACDKLCESSMVHIVSSPIHNHWNRLSTLIITTNIMSSFLYKTFPFTSEYTLVVSISSLVLYVAFTLLRLYNSSQTSVKSLVVFTILLSVLLFKPYNIPLISSLCISSYVISNVLFRDNNFACIVLHLWLGRVYYFLQGSTNSIATIDITVGYIGQTEYNSYIAGVLIYFNMYALNFLAVFLPFCFKSRKYTNIFRINLTFIAINLTFYLFIIYLQRHHLFIWSVFSPKLLLLSSYNVGNIFVLLCLYPFKIK